MLKDSQHEEAKLALPGQISTQSAKTYSNYQIWISEDDYRQKLNASEDTSRSR